MPTDINSFFFLFLFTFLSLVTSINGYDESMQYKSCSSSDNYTDGSTYLENLQVLLGSLEKNTAGTTFFYFNDTVGGDSDKVYGMAMCYAYDDQRYCEACVAQAAKEILQYCPNSKSGTVWYWPCRLRYSDQSFFSVLETSSAYSLHATNSVIETTEFKDQLDQVINQVIARAITVPYLFALGQSEVAVNKTIYAFVQCTQDLKRDECGQCLKGYKEDLMTCCGQRDMTVTSGLSCHIVFALHAFYPPGALISYKNPPALPAPQLPSQSPSLPPNMQPPSPVNTLVPPPPDLVPTGAGSSGSKTKVVAVAAICAFSAFFILALAGLLFWRRKYRNQLNSTYSGASYASPETPDASLECSVTSEFRVFQLSEIKFATYNFSEENKLGEGGFGPVYKGALPDGKQIAVKRLAGWSKQGYVEFKNEVDFLAKLKHKNLVKLLGYCLEKNEKLLCYEYLPCGSLDEILFATEKIKREKLSWQTRYKIIEGISSGLQYLHIESGSKIIHRDLKPSNILLDEHMNPKISDLGLARLYQDDQTCKATLRIAGTFGYMPPEYANYGMYSEKLDVYSFGIMLLEIVTGRRNNSFCNNQYASSLRSHVWQHWAKGEVDVLKDPALEDACLKQLSRCIHIGLLCVQENPNNRPNMEAINFMLRNDSISIPALPSYTSTPEFLLNQNSMSCTSNSDLTCSDQTSSSQATEASIWENNMIARLTC